MMQFPVGFEQLLNQQMPQNQVASLLCAIEGDAPVSLRLNPEKKHKLKNEMIASEVPWEPNSYLLTRRPLFAADPAFHAGCYYVQESNSGIIGYLVSQLLDNMEEDALVLDLCAAPGGKSTHIASCLRPGDLLVANEIIHSRTPILHENLSKWGHSNHLVTRADARQFGQGSALFSLIAADMPCSGEGLFRRDKNAMNEWSVQAVDLCADRQRRIASDIWPALKQGGYLIYSTCTFNRQEDEENVDWICKELGAELMTFSFPESWNFKEFESGKYHLFPGETPGEGFFFSVLKKTESTSRKEIRMPKQKSGFLHDYNGYFKSDVSVFEWQKELYFLKHNDENLIRFLLHSLPSVYKPGTTFGRNFDKGFKPDTEFALSVCAESGSFPTCQLSDKEAMSFLRREALKNPGLPNGIHRVEWNQIPLGFVNVVKQNMNNLWPMEWRIRKSDMVVETALEL